MELSALKLGKVTLEGIVKLHLEPKFALLTLDSDFSQIAYVQQDMSICEKPKRR